MTLRLIVLAVLCLAIWNLVAANPLGAKILVVDPDRSVREHSQDGTIAQQISHNSTVDYPVEAMSRLRAWLFSDEVETLGPLVLGLMLLALPFRVSQSKTSSPDELPEAGDSNLRRIGQSWDPRF
jgi:hypothetical protein